MVALSTIVLAAATVACGCIGAVEMPSFAPRLSSTLTLGDGVAFEPMSCQSGQHREFFGTDIVSRTGAKLRAVENPDGTRRVFLTRDVTPQELTSCARSIHIERDEHGRSINDIVRMYGSVDLDCTVDGKAIVGEVRFDNCF